MLRKHITHFFFFLISTAFINSLLAQKTEQLTIGTKSSFRGMSVVSDKIIWVSGSNGTVGKSVDGGKQWSWFIVKGFEKRDFRDIEAFDGKTAIIMAIAEPANILKTTDGGITWKVVFTDTIKGMFLDAMDFSDNQNGMVVGDPVNGKFFLAETKDGGESWRLLPDQLKGIPEEGEAFFAASGSNMHYRGNRNFLLVSGGKSSRIHDGYASWNLPIIQGKESTGANSIAVFGKNAVVVGGDFSADSLSTDNCILFTLSNKFSFKKPTTPPHGYRSCVEYVSKNKLIACGTSGVDVSTDGGLNWKLISTEGFHVCMKAKKGKAVFLAGSNGKIAKLTW